MSTKNARRIVRNYLRLALVATSNDRSIPANLGSQLGVAEAKLDDALAVLARSAK